jgi:hypothetical protein
MTLALLVALAMLLVWPVLLFLRWARVLPVTHEISRQAIYVAGAFSSAMVGGVYPIVWAMISNLLTWSETGRTVFTFAGHLPPGVDEDDLLAFIVAGLMVLVAQAVAAARRFIVEVNPQPEQ